MERVGKAVGQAVGLLDLVAQFGKVGIAMFDGFELCYIAVADLNKFGNRIDTMFTTECIERVETLADFG